MFHVYCTGIFVVLIRCYLKVFRVCCDIISSCAGSSQPNLISVALNSWHFGVILWSLLYAPYRELNLKQNASSSQLLSWILSKSAALYWQWSRREIQGKQHLWVWSKFQYVHHLTTFCNLFCHPVFWLVDWYWQKMPQKKLKNIRSPGGRQRKKHLHNGGFHVGCQQTTGVALLTTKYDWLCWRQNMIGFNVCYWYKVYCDQNLAVGLHSEHHCSVLACYCTNCS